MNSMTLKENKEINALLHLLDDPDREIYNTVSEKILHYGKRIIPNLEDLWEHTQDSHVQERIENIIHKVNFNEVYNGFETWFKAPKPNLLAGAILLARYRFPELNEDPIRKTIKSIYQSCWLEINSYLTPLERISIVNSIFYSMYKFKGFDLDSNKPNHFCINEVIDSRSGNNYSLGILYQILCEMLDIPVYMIQLPRQCMLAYFDTLSDFYDLEKTPVKKIQFYIDPSSGSVFTQQDVNAYLSKYKLATDANTYLPLSNKDLLCHTMEALALVYEDLKEPHRQQELVQLAQLRFDVD